MRKNDGAALRVLHSKATFQRLLCNEQRRTDRSGFVFSICIIKRLDEVFCESDLQRWDSAIARNASDLDFAGTASESSIAIVFPYTVEDEATQILLKIAREYNNQTPSNERSDNHIELVVHSYPHDYQTKFDRQSSTDKLNDASGNRETHLVAMSGGDAS